MNVIMYCGVWYQHIVDCRKCWQVKQRCAVLIVVQCIEVSRFLCIVFFVCIEWYCVLCIVYCALCIVYCVLCIMYHVLCIVNCFCVSCIVHCVLGGIMCIAF